MRPLSVRRLHVLAYLFVASCVVASLSCLWVAIAKNLSEGHTPGYIYNAVFHDIHLPGRYLYFNYWYFTNQLLAKTVGMHPVYLAMYLLVAGIIFVKLEWQQKSRLRRAALYAILCIFFLLIILLSSRTQLFCTGLALAYGFVRYVYLTKQFFRATIFLLIGVVTVSTIVLFNPIIRERILQSNLPGAHFSDNKYGEGGLSLRSYKWHYTLETIKPNLIFGYGTGDGQPELEKIYSKRGFKIGLENHFNPHNQYLQSSLDLGLLGLAAVLLLVGRLLLVSYRKKNEVMLLVTAIISISFISESMLELNKGVVFFAFIPLFADLCFSNKKSA